MQCYLCSSATFSQRNGSVRDDPTLKILECQNCGLVQLHSQEHLQEGHYENSGMHGAEPPPIETMLRNSAEDDERRFQMLRSLLPNKRILDFGCGNAGFLLRAKTLTQEALGIELEKRVQEYWAGKLKISSKISSLGGGRQYDLITAFHVIEHLPDPLTILQELREILSSKGRIVIEVPSSSDALLTLYECEAFQRFTYWSQHLYLFNSATLETLAKKAGLRVIAIEQFQRYPLSNHLYWLSQGKPGGHQQWNFLDSSLLQQAYAEALAKQGRCDTLIAHLGTYE